MNVNAKVAEDKRKHPERFCPAPRCLWRTMISDPITRQMKPAENCADGYCPRHRPAMRKVSAPKCAVLDWIRNGYQFPGKPIPGGVR
jgi:hypothetical protein